MSPSRYLAPLLALCRSACSEMGYYAQATRGQLQILSAREDITDIVSNPDTPAELRMRLELEHRRLQPDQEALGSEAFRRCSYPRYV